MADAPEVIQFGAPPDFACPPVRSLHALWREKRGGRAMPSRADFDVLELKPWFGRLIIWQTVPDESLGPPDFLYRLIGTHLTRYAKTDLTGTLVSQNSYTDEEGSTLTNLREIQEAARPRYRNDARSMGAGMAKAGERLFLPLSQDGVFVDRIMGYVAVETLMSDQAGPARLPGWSPSLNSTKGHGG